MIRTTIRELNELEKTVLENYLAMEKPPREPKGPWLGCLILSFIFGGLAYFFWGTGRGFIFVSLFGLCFLIAIFLSIENFKWRKQRLGVELRLLEALEDKRVEVAQVMASEVIFEFNEHGPNVYYFHIGSNRILRVELGSIDWPFKDPGDGHSLYVKSGSDKWPNTQFEIVKTVTDNFWVGIFCLGEKLDPIRQINIVEEDVLVRKRESPAELIEGSFEELVKTVKEKPIDV